MFSDSNFVRNYQIRRYLLQIFLVLLADQGRWLIMSIMSGHYYGIEVLTAINLYSPVVELTYALINCLVLGALVPAAYAIGNGDYKEASQRFSLSLMSCGVIFTLLAAIFTPTSNRVTLLLCPQDGLCQIMLEQFFPLMIWEVIPYSIFSVLVYFVGIDGNIKLGGLASMALVVSTVLCNYFFGTFTDLSIRGCAISAIISDFVGIAVMLLHFLRKKGSPAIFRVRLSKDFA